MTESKQCMIKEKSRLEMDLRNQTWPLLSVDGFRRYQPPNLAISTLYWKAWPLLLVVAAFNPENIGECGRFSGYQFRCKNWPRCFLQKSACLCARPVLGWWGNCSEITVYPLWVKNAWRWDLDQHVAGITFFVLWVLWAVLKWVCVSPPWNVLEYI